MDEYIVDISKSAQQYFDSLTVKAINKLTP